MPATSDERALALALAERDDADLADLLAARAVSASAAWRDFFDAAEALLDPASIARGLAVLPLDDAVALDEAVRAEGTVAPESRPRLASAGLTDAAGRPFSAVAVAVGDRESPARVTAGARTASADEDAAAAERAFTSAASLADILLHALRHPLTRIGSGALGAADRRGLVDAGAAADADAADLLVSLAERTGLLRADERAWLVTESGRAWVSSPTSERWALAARRLRDAMPAALRTADGGWIAPTTWHAAYPYDTAWPSVAGLWRAYGVAWGLLAPGGGEPPWARPMAAGGDPDLAALGAYLPSEVDRIYLQNDLTAIAPGPLPPALDVRLRSMAVRESRAQASTYRFSAESLAAAITAGETADSVRAFLREISLTGIPQPLEYLIARNADRHGLLRVGADDDGRTRVLSDDPATLETVAVDQALRPLGLVRDGASLATRVSAGTVLWALADARYPVVAVDEDGAPQPVDRLRVAADVEPVRAADRYADLLARLRAGSAGDDTDAAWLERELDQAVRARAVIDVVVRLPDGSSRTFRLEASGLGGGRLRGRDRGADVERTLPLASIASVHPVA